MKMFQHESQRPHKYIKTRTGFTSQEGCIYFEAFFLDRVQFGVSFSAKEVTVSRVYTRMLMQLRVRAVKCKYMCVCGRRAAAGSRPVFLCAHLYWARQTLTATRF